MRCVTVLASAVIFEPFPFAARWGHSLHGDKGEKGPGPRIVSHTKLGERASRVAYLTKKGAARLTAGGAWPAKCQHTSFLSAALTSPAWLLIDHLAGLEPLATPRWDHHVDIISPPYNKKTDLTLSYRNGFWKLRLMFKTFWELPYVAEKVAFYIFTLPIRQPGVAYETHSYTVIF